MPWSTRAVTAELGSDCIQKLIGHDVVDVIWGDNVIWGENLVWGDNVVWGESDDNKVSTLSILGVR